MCKKFSDIFVLREQKLILRKFDGMVHHLTGGERGFQGWHGINGVDNGSVGGGGDKK